MTTSALDIALDRFALGPWLVRHGFVPQGRAKLEHVADCPWCLAEDKLSVNVETRARRCFVCLKRFKLLDLIAKYEGSYKQAIDVVLSETGVFHSLDFVPDMELKAHALLARDPSWEPYPIPPPEHFERLTAHHPYTARRGFPIEAIQARGVGICASGFYGDRLVFPVRRSDGAWLYFQTRATWEKSEQVPGRDGKVRYRKNLNYTSDDPKIATASDVLMGFEIASRFQRVAIVEGPTDLIQSGWDAVATLGKVVSDRHVQLLVRAGVREVDLCYDPDAWELPVDKRTGRPTGRPAPAQLAAEKLSNAFQVRVVHYPDGDPGSHTPAENWQLRMAARPFGDGSRLSYIP